MKYKSIFTFICIAMTFLTVTALTLLILIKYNIAQASKLTIAFLVYQLCVMFILCFTLICIAVTDYQDKKESEKYDRKQY